MVRAPHCSFLRAFADALVSPTSDSNTVTSVVLALTNVANGFRLKLSKLLLPPARFAPHARRIVRRHHLAGAVMHSSTLSNKVLKSSFEIQKLS